MGKSLESEIESLKSAILTLGAKVEKCVSLAASAVINKDIADAEQIINNDNLIDEAEVEIEELCLKILATQQPVARDLRFVIGVLKVNNDLERIADLAVNAAERYVALSVLPPVQAPFDIETMADKVVNMLRRCLDALVNSDIELASKVREADHEINEMNREMYQKVFAAVKENPGQVQSLMQYVSMSRHLERIGDYCTNIAEDVIYMVKGKIVRHHH